MGGAGRDVCTSTKAILEFREAGFTKGTSDPGAGRDGDAGCEIGSVSLPVE